MTLDALFQTANKVILAKCYGFQPQKEKMHDFSIIAYVTQHEVLTVEQTSRRTTIYEPAGNVIQNN